jgi:hypothetical protein
MKENRSEGKINKDLSGEDLFPNPSSSVLNDQEIRELDLIVNPVTKTVVIQKTLTIPIKWPYRLDFFRVHPDPSWIMTVATIEWEHRHYVLTPELYQRYELEAEIKKLVPPTTNYRPKMRPFGAPVLAELCRDHATERSYSCP